MTTVAVTTTLNEQDTIGPLVAALRSHVDRVIVVDDASDDNTAHNAHHAGAVVVTHALRTGIGPSLMEGWRMALDCGATAVVQIDAGGSHFTADVPRMISKLALWYTPNNTAGMDADMVIGSRFCPGAQYIGNRKRALLSRLAAHMCNNRQVNPRFTDWTSGYRAFNSHALKHLIEFGIYRTTMHSWQIETLRNAIDLNLHIVEVPITYHAGRSSFNRRIAKDALKVWATI